MRDIMSGRALEGMTGLIVDDVDAIRALISRLATGLGCAEVHDASEVDSAWSILMAHQIDFILLDYDLNGESGLKLVRRLRHSGACGNRDVPVIVLTSHAEAEIVERSIAAGANAYLVKPVMPDRLAERILQVTGKPDNASSPCRVTEVSWKANRA
jgi:two-component system chemotaxis response regulator CheY